MIKSNGKLTKIIEINPLPKQSFAQPLAVFCKKPSARYRGRLSSQPTK
jgi:hypothetical protein